jgi:hypothetical protein
MPWVTFKSNDGTYLVNWEGITRILRSSARAAAMVKWSKEVVAERHVIGPDLFSVDVEWNKVRNDTAVQTEMELRRFHGAARRSMQLELNRLTYMMETADKNHGKFQKMMQEAQEKTRKNIEVSVQNNEAVIRDLRLGRDLCGEFVMVGAAYLGGAMAVAAVATASAMKSGFAYQDSGKTGDAVATFFTNLVLGATDFKVGAAIEKKLASHLDKVALNIVWAKAKGFLDIPKSLLEGKHLNEAAAGGAVKAAAATPVAAGVEQLKSYLDALGMKKWAIPVEVALNMLQDKGGDMLAKSGEKASDSGVPPKPVPPVHRSEHLMDAVIYDHSIIEQSAVRKIAPLARQHPHRLGAR